jgi:HSP20 family protein
VKKNGKQTSKEANVSQTLPEQQRSRSPQERWQPMAELEQMTERMRRMLEQTFGGFDLPSTLTERTGWAPLVDIEEQDDAYVIQADLPGVKPEDVNIEVVGNELTIDGEIKEQERKGIVRRRTRRVGRFHYEVRLPEQVDSEKIEAKLNDGVLSLRIPKSERAQRRRIDVSS